MDSDIQSVKKEKKILKISFFSGLFFALAELIFAIYSHSQSVLTDAVYDASELVFIALLLFLTPLFHKPVTEKHPYGYFQIESIFLIIKGFMMLSVSLGVFANITETLLSGGNSVKSKEISVFQMILGVVSIFIYCFMKKNNSNLSSPTINAELLAPERFGRTREYALGKLSGKANIRKNLEALGLELSEEKIQKVTQRIIELGDKKEIVTQEDLPFIVADQNKSFK